MSDSTIDESTASIGGTVSVRITAQPLTLSIPSDLESRPALAIAQGIADKIRAITKMAPNGKHRAFNNSGTLANELTAILGSAGYDVVAPPGYLQDDAVFEKLIALVPAIQDPTLLDELAAAVEAVSATMLTVG